MTAFISTRMDTPSTHKTIMNLFCQEKDQEK